MLKCMPDIYIFFIPDKYVFIVLWSFYINSERVSFFLDSEHYYGIVGGIFNKEKR